MIPKSISTSFPILPLFAERYSGICFDSQREVSHEQLIQLAEAARWAPSCFGDQPWRFIICSKAANPQGWEKAYSCLMEGNQAWCINAPVLLISCCDTLLSKNDKPNPFASYDTGAAAVSMCLQATSMGLMTHQMGGFFGDKARELFNIPERFKPQAMMALGYQLPEDKLPEGLRGRELAPRTRNPLSAHFFAAGWGEEL